MKKGTDTLMKFKQLKRALDIPKYACKGLLQEMWDFASLNTPRGDIGRYSNSDLACEFDWSGDPDELIGALVKFGWIDEHPEHRIVVHAWAEHCEDSIHMRLARAGMVFADGTIPNQGRLSKKDRKDIPQEPQTHQKVEKHDMRTESAQEAHSERTTVPYRTDPNRAVPIPLVRATADTDACASERNGTARLGEIVGVTTDIGTNRTEQFIARILRQTREPPDFATYWRSVGAALKAVGAIDCLVVGITHIETTSGLTNPGAWLTSHCSAELKKHNKPMPKLPKKVRSA